MDTVNAEEEKEAPKGGVMSARICRGYFICMSPRGEIVEGVWSVLPETARVQAEQRLERPWADLDKDGYGLVQGEFWSYP